ncbi:MAG: UbiA family prenyltransferase [Lentisphaerae bacterium]|nr:UbiA family prenyltransferase [Lentisphaerota bacterium]
MISGGRTRAWFELLRIPNLPTVPGDPLAGYALALAANGARAAVGPGRAIAAALLFYAAGLLWNDVADRKIDAVERPERPLPGGRVSSRAAALVGAVWAVMGLALAWWAGVACGLTAVCLLVLVLLYDFAARRGSWLGCLNMGLCRGMSLVLGAACVGGGLWRSPGVLLAATAVTAYVTAVSALAARETGNETVRRLCRLPSVAAAAGLLLFSLSGIRLVPAAVLAGIAAVLWAWHSADRLKGIPAPGAIAPVIGMQIRGLLLFQAAFCACLPGIGPAVAGFVLLLWPVSAILARRFYAS